MTIIVKHTAQRQESNGPILGIDPGTRICGYAVIRSSEPPALIAHGTLKLRKETKIHQRVHELYQGIRELIETWAPAAMAVEEPVVGINSARSSLAVGKAHAAAVIAAGEATIEVSLHGPTKVKLNATGSGRAKKAEVRLAMRAMFGLDATPAADAADAMAIALCHLNEARAEDLKTRR